MPLWICIEGGFLGVSVVKNLPVNAGDPGDASWILESARSPGEGNGNPLECSCLQNPIDRRAWWATVHGVTKNGTQISNQTETKRSNRKVKQLVRGHTASKWERRDSNPGRLVLKSMLLTPEDLMVLSKPIREGGW